MLGFKRSADAGSISSRGRRRVFFGMVRGRAGNLTIRWRGFTHPDQCVHRRAARRSRTASNGAEVAR